MKGSAFELIVRNWAALSGPIGFMLIYGAFVPAVRRYSPVIAGISKVVFIFLILSLGTQYLEFGAGTPVIIDFGMVVLFNF